MASGRQRLCGFTASRTAAGQRSASRASRIAPALDRPQPECLHGHGRFAHRPRSHAAPSWLAAAGESVCGYVASAP